MGLAIAIPGVLYLHANPIPLGDSEEMTAAFEMIGAEPVITALLQVQNPLYSALAILAVALIAAFYPALRASRGRPVDVLRSL